MHLNVKYIRKEYKKVRCWHVYGVIANVHMVTYAYGTTCIKPALQRITEL